MRLPFFSGTRQGHFGRLHFGMYLRIWTRSGRYLFIIIFYSCLNSSAFSFSLFSLDVIQFLRHICEYSFGILSISSYHSRDLNLNVFFTTFHLINNNFFCIFGGGGLSNGIAIQFIFFICPWVTFWQVVECFCDFEENRGLFLCWVCLYGLNSVLWTCSFEISPPGIRNNAKWCEN